MTDPTDLINHLAVVAETSGPGWRRRDFYEGTIQYASDPVPWRTATICDDVPGRCVRFGVSDRLEATMYARDGCDAELAALCVAWVTLGRAGA
jgi:hypothetical protein